MRQKPLVLMECSVIDECYMGKGETDEALQMMNELKDTCKKMSGNFTMLWHNSALLSDKAKSMYIILDKVKQKPYGEDQDVILAYDVQF